MDKDNGEEPPTSAALGPKALLARKRLRTKPRPEAMTLPTLAQIAAQWTAERLRAVAAIWKIPAEAATTPPDILRRLRAEEYFRPLEAALPDDQRHALSFIAVHGGVIEPDELLLRQFCGDRAAFDRAILPLQTAGILHEAQLDCPEPAPVLFIPSEFLSLIELPPHLEGYLGRLLRGASEELLRDIAKRVLAAQKPAETSDALALRIRRVLLDPVELMSHINSLSDVEHEIFRVLTDRRGFALYKDLLENVTSRKVDHSRAEVLNGLLHGSGLAFTASEGHNKHMNLAAIPRDIAWIIANGFKADTRGMAQIDLLASAPVAHDSLTIHQNTGRILRDLAILAGKVDVHRVRKLAAGGINRIELRRIHEIVAPQKPIGYIELLSQFLIQDKHLFEVDGRWRATDRLGAFFQNSPAAWWSLYVWWLRTTAWAEDILDRSQSGPESQAAEAVAILGLRALILEAAASAGRDNWVPISTFLKALRPRSRTPCPTIPGAPAGGGCSCARSSRTWLERAFIGSA